MSAGKEIMLDLCLFNPFYDNDLYFSEVEKKTLFNRFLPDLKGKESVILTIKKKMNQTGKIEIVLFD